MSLDHAVKQCCDSEPVWIFIYPDGSVFAVCDKDFQNPTYRIGVKEIINLDTQESVSPENLGV